MAYSSWSVVFSEQPSAAKWNILGTNDASFNNGTGLPVGTCVQIASQNFTAVATGTTTVPQDNTIPQNTEGDEYMTLAITPRSTTNVLVIDVLALAGNSTATNNVVGALFQDSTANALSVGYGRISSDVNSPVQVKITHRMVAGTSSSTTFKVRIGGVAGGTTTFNGAASASLFGAITKSSIIIREYTA